MSRVLFFVILYLINLIEYIREYFEYYLGGQYKLYIIINSKHIKINYRNGLMNTLRCMKMF